MKTRAWWIGLFVVAPLALLSVLRGQEPPKDATNAPDAAAKQAALPPGVTVQKDIEYVPGGGKSRSLDLYLPEASAQPAPLVIFVHGGGWRSGNKDGCPAKFLAGFGYVVASLNYRLSREAAFPADIDDCRAALKFLRAGAATYHIQPDHVGVWGGSAGGHLVALMGIAPGVDFGAMPAKVADVGKVDRSLQVQCVVDMYGASDFTLLMVDKAQVEHGVGGAAIQLLGPTASQDELMTKSKWASPITYVRSDNPPFLIQHGDADQTMPLEQSRVLDEALKKAGVESTFTVMPGAGHAGAAFFTEENHKTLLEFFDKHLKPAK